MLSVACASRLVLADVASCLKRPPTSLPPTCVLESTFQPTASAWSADGTSLYLASAHSIARYDAAGTLVKTVHDDPQCEDIRTIVVAKDKGTIIFAAGTSVHFLEHSASAASTSRIVHSLSPHPDSEPINALSLSNDNTLLAVASPYAVLVHNLSLGSQTMLRGLPSDSAVGTCTFHPHSRVRLFLGTERQLLVYDITRPLGPSRVIQISDSAGKIVALSCSPYSKTLLAVACTDGRVVLVDLDKEKGRIRSFNYDTTLTSLTFSPDGATLYVGTEGGTLLVQTLRVVESPKTVELGDSIRCLTVTKKTRLSGDLSLRASVGSPASTKPTPHDISGKDPNREFKFPSALRRPTADTDDARSGKAALPNGTPIRARVTSESVVGSRKAFETARSLFASVSGVSRVNGPSTPSLRKASTTAQNGSPDESKTAGPSLRSPLSIKHPSRASSIASPLPAASTGISKPMTARTRTMSTLSTTARSTVTSPTANTTTRTPPNIRVRKVSSSASTSTPGTARSPPPRLPGPPPARARTTSTISRPATTAPTSRATSSGGTSPRTTTTRPTSVNTTPRERSPVPPVPVLPSKGKAHMGAELVRTSSQASTVLLRTPSQTGAELLRTPSPGLMDELPPFTVSVQNTPQRKGLSMLGLATPEVEKWIEGGNWKGKAKAVEQDQVHDDGEGDRTEGEAQQVNGATAESSGEGDPVQNSADPPASTSDAVSVMLDAPQAGPSSRERPLSMQLTPRRRKSGTWAPSPLRNSVADGSPSRDRSGNVQNMLHALVKDAMLDLRLENKAQMAGLHLDLIRLGSTWRQEMRDSLQEYVGDLHDLREENKRLREENERLRRGY
ncbi:WD40 repeat-like protein, partial [Peniophora sp. CONT]